jgi:hypothetical protein
MLIAAEIPYPEEVARWHVEAPPIGTHIALFVIKE